MINYRVRDLDALLARLRSQGVQQAGDIDEYSYGRFAWIIDGILNCTFRNFMENDAADLLVVVCNMTPVPRQDYRIGAPRAGDYVELINSDADCYGGSGIGNLGRVRTEPVSTHGHEQSLKLNLPPLATLILKPV